MTPYYSDDLVTLYHGDCLYVLRELPDCSVDSVVTDPPYSLTFMGRAWDSHPTPAAFGAWCELWAVECLRILKPGGHLLAFGGTRTWHRLVCAVEDAGFEIRDSIAWMYGSGFPKSLDVSKAIDRAAGAEREVVGTKPTIWKGPDHAILGAESRGLDERGYVQGLITAPATEAAQQWQGWGTALKPAHEPICVARKPLSGTVAANVLAHGTGALNIDAGRIGVSDSDLAEMQGRSGKSTPNRVWGAGIGHKRTWEPTTAGRWPANVVLDESQAVALDEMSGERASSGLYSPNGERCDTGADGATDFPKPGRPGSMFADSGGASRYFYTAKAGSDERITYTKPGSGPTASNDMNRRCLSCGKRAVVREFGSGCRCENPIWQPTEEHTVSHPTVKPLSLMRWLVRLVTPPGGLILEPFAGSGTTVEAAILEGFRCIAIEREADYLPLITQRINRRRDPIAYITAAGEDLGLFDFEEPA